MRKILLSLLFFYSLIHALSPQDLYAEGKYREALTAYEKALPTSQVPALVWYNIGNCYQQLGESKKAVTAWLQATTEKPDLQKAYENSAAVAYAMGDYPLAMSQARAALSLSPQSHNMILILSETSRKLHSWSDAMRYTEQYMELDPTYSRGHMVLAEIALELSDTLGALDHLQEYPQSGEAYTQCLYRMGNLYESTGQFEQALFSFRKSYSLDSDNQWARYKVLLILWKQDKKDLAWEYAQQFYEENSFGPFRQFMRISTY